MLIVYTLLLEQVDLHFSHAALRSVAEEALAKKTGARGLRRIMVRKEIEANGNAFIHKAFSGGFAARSHV